MAQISEELSRLDNPASVETDVAPPDRSSSSSAPPALRTESLFAWKVEYAKLFSDIRSYPDYAPFVSTLQETEPEKARKLPQPLEGHFLFQEALRPDDDEHESSPYNRAFHGQQEQRDQNLMYNEMQNNFHNMQLNEHRYASEHFAAVQMDSSRERSRGHASERGGVRNPIPRKPNHHISVESSFQNDHNRFGEATYSSSPSAQTAFGAAHFIWKDEDSTQHNGHQSNQIDGYGMKAMNKSPTPGYANSFAKQMPLESINQDNGAVNGQQRNPNVICRYYASGYCSRGEKCFFSHDTEQNIQGVKSDNKTNRNASKLKPNTVQSYARAIQNPSSVNTVPVTHVGSSVSTSAPTVTTPAFNKASNGNTISPRPVINTSPPPAIVQPQLTQSDLLYTNFEQLIGKIYLVSKDQQGCRFLQKKLEEQDVKAVQTIFDEVYHYITELMTDPFGNYLCQKLLEHCTDDQRLMIVERVAPDLVEISKNMHGTRAVQKMIECLSSPAQVQLIKRALSDSVVELIQDLNGNHVIQRCLNRLSPEDNQFIYDAVTTGSNCVQVATHRHGCCVLQRCIDHASEKQKVQLINEITKNALVLVQDPYGNYVVQYVLELPFPNLIESLARSFAGHLRQLATQKFSSNVVEKCLAVAGPSTRLLMITEVLADDNLIAMLQDPFANYVVQTALTVSDPQQHVQLVEAIKPYINQLRNTPYGKRIQSKIAKESAERQGGSNGGGGGKRDHK